jgi:hypothetical protein
MAIKMDSVRYKNILNYIDSKSVNIVYFSLHQTGTKSISDYSNHVLSNLQFSADVMITKCFIFVFTANSKEVGKLIFIHTSVLKILKNEGFNLDPCDIPERLGGGGE